ncbi:Ribose ABC transporter permease [Methylocella tundrae]|uniref:Ribose ABC transporter permease n=1 Tax=Methylocella tundrae TaxID=227605 RepID=A0A8B6M142_METTU|nr:rRNA adenine N-6-methyltransferase family protein [Methylocella tundrae]VTZ27098.1 Ribose ABC transporter permease [Methylocella tundrae]VTZ48454.1 Ribose ABC transporter permease [Methylocella tundrae]
MLSDPSRADRRGPAKRPMPIEKRLADEARFIRSWFENPLRAGAVSPSGRSLARMMARYVDPHGTGPIIELGPGTGAITEALLARGVAPSRLYLIEFDPNFCKHLQRRFPGVHVVEGDAYRFKELLAGLLSQPASSVVSSLPLLVKPERQRLSLLADAFDCMAPGAAFIQFTYGLLSPIPREKSFGPTFHADRSPPVWLNLPPARVWIYRARASHEQGFRLTRPNPAQEFFDRLRQGTEKIQIDLKREIDGARARLAPKQRAAQKNKRADSSARRADRSKSPRP